MELMCTVCRATVLDSEINAHLRTHDINQYKHLCLPTTLPNLFKLAEHVLIANYNSSYAALKNILDSKGFSARLLPSLDIYYPSENAMEFRIMSGIVIIVILVHKFSKNI